MRRIVDLKSNYPRGDLLNMSASKQPDSTDEESQTDSEDENSSTYDSPEDEELRELTLKLKNMQKKKESKRKKKLAEKKEMIRKEIEEEIKKHNKSDERKDLQGKMRKLEQRTRHLEKRVGDLETISSKIEIKKSHRKKEYCENKNVRDESYDDEKQSDDICNEEKNKKEICDDEKQSNGQIKQTCTEINEGNIMKENCTDPLLLQKCSTTKSFPDEQIKILRVMFETVEDMLSSPDYDADLQDELSKACPNYMTTFETAKRDLLKNDCGIVLAGETSAGKTTLINQLVGQKLFVTGNLATTGTITRIRNSEKMGIKCYLKDQTLMKEEEVQNVNDLEALIKGLTDIKEIPEDLKDIYYVDVYLPVPILKGNVIIVDTPGIGENDKLDQILLDFLPHAVSFVFVVNAKNAGGIHEDRISKILKNIMDNREKMPCFDPREVMFLTNQWDIIFNDEYPDEDKDGKSHKDSQKAQTWNLIQSKLKNGWGWLNSGNVFRVSLRQVDKRDNNFYTEEYKRFQSILAETIDKNKNKRVDFYYRFLKDFIRNAERGALTRLHVLEMSEEEQKESIKQNNAKIQDLQRKCKEARMDLERSKIETIKVLTEKLYEYLCSEDGREEILNPPDKKKICEVKYRLLWREVPPRFNGGIKRWCEGQEVKTIIEGADKKLKLFVKDIELKLQEIEIEMTGTDSNTDVDFSHNGAAILLGVLLLPFVIVFAIVFALIYVPVTLIKGAFVSSEVHHNMVVSMYSACLTQITKDEIRKCFEKSFGVEYSKMIVSIFDNSFPNLLASLFVTNTRLLQNYKDILQKQDCYRRLKKKIQNIKEATDNFERNL